ncbi:hypothetical protein B0X78_10655, partial [bacterium AM6]
TIIELGRANNSTDTVVFGEGLSYDDLVLSRLGSDLLMNFGSDDDLTIRGWFASSSAQVEVLQFADGRRVDTGEINQLIAAMTNVTLALL